MSNVFPSVGRHWLTPALAALLLASQAGAAASSRLDCKGNPNGTKKISPESITDVGPPQNDPLAIVRIVSARFVITDPVAGGVVVRKSVLSPQEAFGQGLPNGYTGGGPRNPTGPWLGLHWPFRDFADGYAPTTGGPTGNEIGMIRSVPTAGLTIVEEISAAMNFIADAPATYLRGLPGNGVTDFTQFFSVDLEFTDMTPRDVLIVLEPVLLDVLVRNRVTGAYSVDRQETPTTSLVYHVPAPAGAGWVLAALPLARRRRRM